MASSFPNRRAPGVQTGPDFAFRHILRSGEPIVAPGYVIVDGSNSRDPLNTGDVDTLRAGLVLGQVSANELYAPSFLGVSTVAYDASATVKTALTVSAATATEIVRRIGSSGTFKLIGPPAAAGTVATQTVTFSAVNTTTGVVTVTAIAADAIAGSFIADTDGSEAPLALLLDECGVKVVDYDSNDIDVPVQAIVGGMVDSSQIVNWPSDTSLQTWLKGQLNTNGRFVFDDAFVD